MISKIRKTPIVCLIISVVKLLSGSLRFSKKYLDKTIAMENKKKFVVFRHITTYPLNQVDGECVFIVSFKFAHLSHKANRLASIIPMLMISGFPGFVAKMYAVNPEDGYWQGMYQWKSINNLNEYKKSFVFKMMNKRSIKDSTTEMEFDNMKLTDFLDKHKIVNLSAHPMRRDK